MEQVGQNTYLNKPKKISFHKLKQIYFLAVLYVTKHTKSGAIKPTAIITLAQPGY